MSDFRVLPFGPPRRALTLILAGIACGGPCAAQPDSSVYSGPNIDEPSFPTARIQRSVVFFPPVPPPLDWPVTHFSAPTPAIATPPSELATYVYEPFYAPLSTRLAKNDLSDKLRQRLDAYRSARTNLRDELHAELARVRDFDSTSRQRALEALARGQAPRLAALEKSAEQLREALISSDYDWSALREWRLGDAVGRSDSPSEVAQVMRAYAFYHADLLPAQRGMLREISMEFALAGEDVVSATATQPFFFFSPEPARVKFPDDLPAPVAALIADYQTKKSALKKELYNAAYAEDGASFIHLHGLRNVARAQASRLAALDQLAEEIRRGLAAAALPTPPAERSPLPPVMTTRIATLLQNRTALQKETLARIEAIDRQEETTDGLVRVNYSFDSTGLKFTVQPRRFRERSSREIQRKVEEVTLAMAPIAEEYGRRFTELANETDAIRHEVADSLGTATPAAVEAVLSGAVRYAVLSETEAAYRDYRTAVFEPGLSPEQRRLLFGSAVEQLDLPLPSGNLQPGRRGNW